MSDRYYDRQGNRITFQRYMALLGMPIDHSYKVVKQETTPLGFWVSTVWLGLDHRFGETSGPLIFETMVFSDGAGEGATDEQERYSTEEAALLGHERMVARYSSREWMARAALTDRDVADAETLP